MNKILSDALAARKEEVDGYQVNIDNYRLALERLRADPDPDLVDFEQQIESLLKSSIIEQKKAKVMLDVIQSRLPS